MSHLLRLAEHLRTQGPGVPYATHDVAQLLGISRTDAATYLRRAAIRGWVVPEWSGGHGGPRRRPRGSVVVRYVSTAVTPPEPAPVVCPHCGVNPPRYTRTRTLGRVPTCAQCQREKWQEKYKRRVERRTGVVPDRGHDDISPEQIERRFNAALALIRRRA